jgi:hypothetical protein
MPIRVRFIKRLFFRLLLTASLLIAPILVWVGFPFVPVFVEEGSARTAVTDETFSEDAEWEARAEAARPASQARLRVGRRVGKVLQFDERAAGQPLPHRFKLVVDIRRIKPRRLLAPPYLRPRVVRLLS